MPFLIFLIPFQDAVDIKVLKTAFQTNKLQNEEVALSLSFQHYHPKRSKTNNIGFETAVQILLSYTFMTFDRISSRSHGILESSEEVDDKVNKEQALNKYDHIVCFVIFMSKCRQVHIRKTGKDTQIIDH
jgi:hypothetical protein